ncbi:MAG: prepilin peptidase [Candidatus Omnitrophota bacterium]
MIEALFVFVLGAVVGSFLNVCIYRMPLGESIVWPGSHCTKCKKSIPWYDNIPFLSYIALRGKCRFCKQAISPRYFLVEFLTACAFLIFYNLYGLSYQALVYTVFVCGLIVATFVDFQHRIIPDEISVGGIFAGLLLSLIKPYAAQAKYELLPIYDSLLGVVLGGGIIYLTGFLFDLVYFKMLKKGPVDGETSSMGGGDVKLLAMIGAFLGWKAAVLTFFLAPFFGAMLGLANLIMKKEHTIPYGPFLSMAAVLCIFWTEQIIYFVMPSLKG